MAKEISNFGVEEMKKFYEEYKQEELETPR